MEDKTIDVSSKIQSISCDNFKVEKISAEEKKSIDSEKFAFEFSLNLKIDATKREIRIHCLTKIYSTESKELYLGELNSTGVFELHNYEEVMKVYKGIPNVILSIYVGALIATTRGFLILKSEGTILQGALLPIINASTFFPQTSESSNK